MVEYISRAMDAQRTGLMQMQIRHNAEDLESYLKDLQSWEDEVKEKDRALSKQKPILKEVTIKLIQRTFQSSCSLYIQVLSRIPAEL